MVTTIDIHKLTDEFMNKTNITIEADYQDEFLSCLVTVHDDNADEIEKEEFEIGIPINLQKIYETLKSYLTEKSKSIKTAVDEWVRNHVPIYMQKGSTNTPQYKRWVKDFGFTPDKCHRILLNTLPEAIVYDCDKLYAEANNYGANVPDLLEKRIKAYAHGVPEYDDSYGNMDPYMRALFRLKIECPKLYVLIEKYAKDDESGQATFYSEDEVRTFLAEPDTCARILREEAIKNGVSSEDELEVYVRKLALSAGQLIFKKYGAVTDSQKAITVLYINKKLIKH